MGMPALVKAAQPGTADKIKAPKAKGAPEIDPAVLGGAAVVLVGGTVLVGSRIRRRRAS
jgi:hypothetical protein